MPGKISASRPSNKEDNQRKLIRLWAEQGWPTKTLAEKLNVTDSRIRQRLHESGYHEQWREHHILYKSNEQAAWKTRKMIQSSQYDIMLLLISSEIVKLSNLEGKAAQHAVSYIFSISPKGSIDVLYEKCLAFYQRYEDAKIQGTHPPVDDLAYGLFSVRQAHRLLQHAELKPFRPFGNQWEYIRMNNGKKPREGSLV